MIITGQDGRRRSQRLVSEDAAEVREAFALLPVEARALFGGLLEESGDPEAEAMLRDVEVGLYNTPPVSMRQFIEDPYYLGESMVTVYPALRDDLIALFDDTYREVLITGSIGIGKCVDGDTELYDPVAGRRVTVAEASRGKGLHVVAWDGNVGRVFGAVAAESGRKTLGWLTLGNGVKVRMSPDHPVLTASGYVAAADLRPGDLVASLRRIPAPAQPLDVSDDIVLWVAYMLADGGMTTNSMTFTNQSQQLHDEFALATMVLSRGGDEDGDAVRFVRNKGKAWTVRPRGVLWLRERYDLGHHARDKRVPAEFYGLSDRQLALFLNRIWACDGWVCQGKSGCPSIGIALSSEALVRDLQQLLLRFGVISRVRQRKMHYRIREERRSSPAWSLEILSLDNIGIFLDTVGDILGKEDRCQAMRSYISERSGNPNTDITPMDNACRSRLRQEIGPISKKAWWPTRPKHQRLGRRSMMRLREEYALPDWCRWWPDVFWNAVVSYEAGSALEPVYDVEVPGAANFTPGGLIVHNSFVARAAICRVLYELSCLKEPQVTFGLSPGTEMVIILISRNLVLAREVMKTSIDDSIKLSPYFMEKFAPKFGTDFTLFPNNIRLTIGSYGSERALGTNVMSCWLDECLGKKSLLSVFDNGKSAQVSVGDLWALGPAGRDGLLVEALDHATGQHAWTPFRMRASTVQPLVRIEAQANASSRVRAIEPSLEHPLLVRRGDWLVYVPAAAVVVGDELVWRCVDGEEGRAVVGGTEDVVVGDGESADWGAQPVLGAAPQRGNEGGAGGAGTEAVYRAKAQRGNEGEDVVFAEGAHVFCGDKGQDVGSEEGAQAQRGGEGEDIGCAEGAHVFRGDEGEVVGGGQSAQVDGGTEAAPTRGIQESPGPCAYGRGEEQDFGGQRAGDQGSGTLVSVPREITGRRIGAVPDGERGALGAELVCGARGGQRGRRGPDGVDPLRVQRAAADDGRGFLGNADRWSLCVCRGKGCRPSLSGQRFCTVGCGLEVESGEWASYDSGNKQEINPQRLDGAICDRCVHRGRAAAAREVLHYVDGRSLGGCRPEALRVTHLPADFQLARVTATRFLPAEQTYSIETGCQTFVADGFVVHNTNFPPKRKAQQITQTMGKVLTAAHFDIVEKVYRAILRRIKSRFQVAGGDFPGMVIMVSSAATLESFTERKLRDARTDPKVFVRDHAPWTAKPKDHFCGKMFYVLCSKSSLRTRILTPKEYKEITDEYLTSNEAWIVEVPIEYRDDFETNLEDSLRDIAGVSTQAISAFFQRIDAIDACITKRPHPFSSEVWVAGGEGSFAWRQMCRPVERRLPGGFTEEAWVPLESPAAPRWIHIDTSVSGDCVTADTLVATPAGNVRIDTITAGTPVYSLGPDGHFTVAVATNPGLKRKDAPLVSVVTDGGVVRCTPDHKFMLRYGMYREARLLQRGDSLRTWGAEWVPGYGVLRVEEAGREDVYCLSVEGAHNFVVAFDAERLSSGVVVHNSSGFAMGRVERWVEVIRRDGDGRIYTDVAPYYIIEVLLCIRPPAGEQIYMPDLRRLVYELQAHGFPIAGFSTDSYSAVEMHQQVRRHGIHTELISMDTTMQPYEELKAAIYEKRIEYYRHEVLLQELRGLEYDRLRGKVDHQRHLSKDCISGDTRVCLLDGRDVPIKDLVGQEHWVYACTPSGEVVPAFAHNVHLVGERPVMRLRFDNGEYLDCTADHEIMLRDGTFAEAHTLGVGSRVMPLYRSVSVCNPKNGLNGYERVLDNKTGRYVFTHQLVAQRINGFKYKGSKNGRVVIHHADFNKRNNSPKNLVAVEWNEHLRLHRDVASENMKKLWENEDYRNRASQWISAIGSKTGKANITKYNRSQSRIDDLKARGIFKANGKKVMDALWKDDKYRERHRERVSGANNPWARKDVTFERIMEVAARTTSEVAMLREMHCTQKVMHRVLRENGLRYADLAIKFGHHYPRGKQAYQFRADVTFELVVDIARRVNKVSDLCAVLKCTPKVYHRVLAENGWSPQAFRSVHIGKPMPNHVVVGVEHLGSVPVYDMTVEDQHNFAVSSGVFVHNCSDSLAGVCWGLKSRAARLPWAADADTPRREVGHEHGWVSPLIPAEDVDVEAVRDLGRDDRAMDLLPPFLMGDD